jgi:hypothetical protein
MTKPIGEISKQRQARLDYQRQWVAANRERHRETCRKWRIANPDKAQGAQQKYRDANREKMRERSIEQRAINPEPFRERCRRYNAANKEKIADRKREKNEANPTISRNNRLRQRYGLTLQDWDALFLNQGNRCAICDAEEPGTKGWHTDHNHDTGGVRGILCHTCNIGLGAFKDNHEALIAAADYLLSHS